MKTELSAGRPVIIAGEDQPNSDGTTNGHWYICDGYRADGLFHIWWGSTTVGGERDQWLPLYGFAPYNVKNWALIGLQPDWSGKTLELVSPAGDEVMAAGTTAQVRWKSSGIANLQIDYSTDNGATWSVAAASVPASAGTWDWIVPSGGSNSCKLRIHDTADVNVYRKTVKAFSIYSGTKTIGVTTAFSGRLLQHGAAIDVTWTRNGVRTVKVEYSLDGGSNWFTAASDVLASAGSYRWTVPVAATANALVRVSDSTDGGILGVSDPFSITPDNVPAAMLAADAATIALFHFEGGLGNASAATTAGKAAGTLTYENGGLHLGQALRIDNTNGGSCMIVPSNDAFALSGDWTIQFWMKANSIGGTYTAYPYVLSRAGAAGDAQPFHFELNDGDRTFTAAIASATGKRTAFGHVGRFEVGEWYHLALVSHASQRKLRFYIQTAAGAVVYSGESDVEPADLTLKNPNTNVHIGGGTGMSNVQFDGWVDELQFTRRAVDPTKVPVTGFSRIANLSIMTSVPAGSSFALGTVVGGGTSSEGKPVLFRAMGPSLSAFGVEPRLEDPRLELIAAGVTLANNDNWSTAPDFADVVNRVGAFPFVAPTSKDAAIYMPALSSGGMSVVISATPESAGIVLAEVYDATPSAGIGLGMQRLLNVSVMKEVGSGFAAGFVVSGTIKKTVLIRAVGPGLAAFQVGDRVMDPRLELFAQGAVIAANDNWGGGATLAAAFDVVGAFGLPSDSKDAALLVTLDPGNYSAQVSGVAGATGTVLMEVYEVP